MRRLPLIVALAVGLAGLAYALVHSPTYESTARLALVPSSEDPAVNADLLSSVSSAGTVGTYVELYASGDVTGAASDPSTEITVRSVPDSRIVDVTAAGEEDAVQQDLRRVLAAGAAQEARLSDFWETVVIQRPSAPEQQRPGTGLILLAALILAILAGLLTAVVLQRVAGPSSEAAAHDGEPPPAHG